MIRPKPKRIPRLRTRQRLGLPEFLEHGFLDPRSHVVTKSGQIILRGVDKTNLRRKVYRRAGGRCEIRWNGKRCNKFAPWDGFEHGELVHRVATKRGGSDDPGNCEWGCRSCHRRRDHPGVQWSQVSRRPQADRDPPQPQPGDAAHPAGVRLPAGAGGTADQGTENRVSGEDAA